MGITVTQSHIPLKRGFLHLRTCGARRPKTPHHAPVRRRKISMLGHSKTPMVPNGKVSSSSRPPPLEPYHSSLLKSIRQGYVRRGTCARDDQDPVVSLCFAKRSRAPLKVEDDDDDGVGSVRAQERVVRFDPLVSYVEIPSRKAYSPKVSEAMWNSRKVIRRAAAKAAIEYAFEQHDWRGAIEEEDFKSCGSSLVHPAHFAVCPS